MPNEQPSLRSPKTTLIAAWTSRHPALVIARILLVVAVTFYGFIMIAEEKFIFFPSKYPQGRWEVTERTFETEGQLAPCLEDVWIKTPDGLTLHGWLVRPHRVEAGALVRIPTRGVMLWCHGNAGNLSDRYRKLVSLAEFPMDLLIIDYRGYGRSEGKPNEQGVYTDVRAAWSHLTNELGYPPDRIILYGVSLGGAIAVDLATEVDAAGLIVESSFTSIPDMAAATMPIIPQFMVRTRMDSLTKIQTITMPKLILHSDADEVIPYAMGQKLYELAAEPKQFYTIPGTGHNETDTAGKPYFDTIRIFAELILPDTPSGP